jgi:hypothetical protein
MVVSFALYVYTGRQFKDIFNLLFIFVPGEHFKDIFNILFLFAHGISKIYIEHFLHDCTVRTFQRSIIFIFVPGEQFKIYLTFSLCLSRENVSKYEI